MNNSPELSHIIIFDGVCNLCSSFVDFIIRKDSGNIFRFAPGQGEAGKKILNDFHLNFNNDLPSVFYLENGKLYKNQEAVMKIIRLLPYPYRFLVFFRIIPPFFRTAVYNFVARHRYHWFGKKKTCRIPSSTDQKKFI